MDDFPCKSGGFQNTVHVLAVHWDGHFKMYTRVSFSFPQSYTLVEGMLIISQQSSGLLGMPSSKSQFGMSDSLLYTS